MARAGILLLFYLILVKLSLEDLQKRKISDGYHWMILVLSAAALLLIPQINIRERMEGMFLVSLPMTILALCRPGSFGGGDIKLVFACGAFLGAELVLKGTVLGIFIAGICSVWILISKKDRQNLQFPFGPFLSAGFLMVSLKLFS